MRIRRGFLWRGKVLRPEEVIAKRFNSAFQVDLKFRRAPSVPIAGIPPPFGMETALMKGSETADRSQSKFS